MARNDVEHYVSLPWRTFIEPEVQEDGRIVYLASHPEFDGVLGTGDTPEMALADLHSALTCAVEALLAEGFPVPEPALTA